MYITVIYVKVLLIFEIYWNGGENMDRQEKLDIITEGQKYGVTKTCEKHAISRTLYYRWLRRYKAQGIDGLLPPKKTTPPANKTPDETANRVLMLIRSYPAYGPREIKYLLEEIGYDISESAVYNIMRRMDLSTREKRMKFSKMKIQPLNHSFPDFSAMKSGECWFFFITSYSLKESAEPLYAYTLIDYKSRIACSRLYRELTMECLEDLLLAAAIPVAQSLDFQTRHLCFLEESSVPCRNRSSFSERVHEILHSSGFDPSLHFMKNEEMSTEILAMKKDYATQGLSSIIPYLHGEHPLSEIKLILQRRMRSYNLSQRICYGEDLCSPVAYHSRETGSSRILPLWAYIDREY